MDIVLASASPRRQELLRQIGIAFRVVPSGVDEVLSNQVSPADLAVSLALAKATDVAERYPDSLVLGADTIVVAGTEVLGKPADAADAVRMLELLVGQAHQVITGVAFVHRASGRVLTAYESTTVHFRAVPHEVLERYADSGEPMDKAGAYAIQGRASAMITGIEGDYFNVVGLPVARVVQMLEQLGIAVL